MFHYKKLIPYVTQKNVLFILVILCSVAFTLKQIKLTSLGSIDCSLLEYIVVGERNDACRFYIARRN